MPPALAFPAPCRPAAWLAGLCMLACSPLVLAQAGLGSAFRPQAAPPPPAAAAAAEAASSADRGPDAAPSGLRVMVLGRERPLAAINGQIVHLGDRVNGMRVVQINREGVLLQGEGPNRERLLVTPSVIKLNRPSTEPAPRAGERP